MARARTQAELQEVVAQIAQLMARVDELEKPAKTPENSSTPPSKAPKAMRTARISGGAAGRGA